MVEPGDAPVGEPRGGPRPLAQRWRVRGRDGIAALAVVVALGTAVLAAFLSRPGLGGVTGGVESVSATAATFLGNAVRVFPLGYALGAGMVAAVNPCGFAMLPAYLGLYVGAGEGEAAGRGLGSRCVRALGVSGTVTFSFILLFGFAGLVLSLAAGAAARLLPWIGLAVGVLIVLVAGRMLAGGTLYTSLGERIADRLQAGTRRQGLPGYFAYGIAYGLASLSCTLPVFLAVVGSALAAGGFLAGALQFLLYALGMGVVITVLTLAVALFKHAVLRGARRALPAVQPVSAVLVLAAGAYIVYYWLTIGGLLQRATG